MSKELTNRKIYPRNLTARSETLVRGNSILTRPESGVENSYPGLEFDQRNIDKRFFPGLSFEFHAYEESAFVRAVEKESTGETSNLNDDDLTAGVFLWAIFGVHGKVIDSQKLYPLDLTGMNGLECWRYIRDLEEGPVSLLMGPSRPINTRPFTAETLAFFATEASNGNERIQRDSNGRIAYAILNGQRRRYLDAEGVIDPDAYEPGDLTLSLCAPWQYDFRDCGCFYWASNKPDIVGVRPDAPKIANFQRVRDQADPTAPIRDAAGWAAVEYNHVEMIQDWEALNTVIDGVETDSFELKKPHQIPSSDIISRDEVIRRLRYLATVEHGLMVEYLYAQYSIKTEMDRPNSAGLPQMLFDARRSILSIAIDEMRHLRWVNEILRELNEPVELGRFTSLEDFDNDSRTLSHDFSLEPLSSSRLDWFIEIEAPSQALNVQRDPGTIDGLYTRLLMNIEQGNDFTEVEKAKISHILKLIIDEGQDHFKRFKQIKEQLSGVDESTYLQLPSSPKELPADHPAKAYETIADQCYQLVLQTLDYVFEVGGAQISEMLSAARHAMYALDDAALAVTSLGGAPLFALPSTTGVELSSIVTDKDDSQKANLTNQIEPHATKIIEYAKSVDGSLANSILLRYEKMIAELNDF